MPAILLVEDDPRHAAGLSLALQGEHTVEVVTTVELAGLSIGEALPDAIVADLSLSDSDGADTVRALRWMAAGVPIVVWTGRTDDAVHAACVEAGASAVVTKPSRGRAVLWRLREVLADRERVVLGGLVSNGAGKAIEETIAYLRSLREPEHAHAG